MKKILFILLCIFSLTSCRTLNKYSHYIYSMNTIITVDIYAESQSDASSYFDEIEKIYQLYNKLSSDYDTYNNICNIKTLNVNRSGIVQEELYELLKYAFEIKEETNGYFEPFIGTLSHKWKDDVLNNENPIIPSNEYIQSQLDIINNSKIIFEENNKITLIGDANLDLGAIAKGYATQKVYDYLQNEGIKNYIINAGNSNVLLGEKPNEENFKIGLKNLEGTAYYEILELKNKAVVTSSYKEQNKQIDNILYTHLINPKTGYPISDYASLTLIGNDSGLLDAYSTAVYSMQLDEIKEFIKTKNIDVIIYGPKDLIYSSVENK